MRLRRSAGDSTQVEDRRRSGVGGGRQPVPGGLGGGFGIDPGAIESPPQAPSAGGAAFDATAPDPERT